MTNADRDLVAHAGQEAGSGPAVTDRAPGSDELKGLLTVIADQISDADRRHSEVLTEMRDRLTLLSEDTRSVRTQVAGDLGPVFTRIEDALTQLADRMDAPHDANADDAGQASRPNEKPAAAQSAPAVLKSAAATSSQLFARSQEPARASQPIDTFDVVDVSVPSGNQEPWDAAQAEALTRIYEDEEGTSAGEMPAYSQSSNPEPAPSAEAESANPAYAASGADRDWLESKFAEIAERIEHSLMAFNPANPLEDLSQRFDLFEQRFGDALHDVASRADVEGLSHLEAQIAELAHHVEQAHAQLSRLDMIEQQITAVIEQMADHRLSGEPAAASFDPQEFERVAEMAAESVAQRFAGAAAQGRGDSAGGELRGLLEAFITEQRQGDEQTISMLDTLQQALIRILDRVDAIEAAQQNAHMHAALPSYGSRDEGHEDAYAREPEHAGRFDGYEPGAMAEHRELADPERSRLEAPAYAQASAGGLAHSFDREPADAPAPQDLPYQPPQASQAESRYAPAPVAAPAAARSPIEKLRQDFIADAQRAKMKAASEPAAPPKPTGLKGVAAAAAANAGTTKIFGMSPKILVIALAAILAINGTMLMFSGGSSAPEPQAPAVTEPAAPAAEGQEGAPKQRSEAPTGSGLAALSHEDAEAIAGLRVQISDELPSAEDFALIRQQQNMAKLSGQVAANTTQYMTPAAFLEDVPAATSEAALTPGSGNAAEAATASRLDLPPATVGPLSLRLAASQGDPSAQFEVAARLAEGKGTAQNFKEAMRWYHRSAAQGFAQSQYRLGTLYERGLGTKADPAFARDWYQRAAEQGNVKAMHNLAVLSASGPSGAPDYASASKWFAAAAQRGLRDSQFNLGVLYESGLGVSKDMVEACKWYALAARGNDKDAQRRLDAAKTQLAPAELADAEARAASFAPMPVDALINDARVAGEDWKRRQAEG